MKHFHRLFNPLAWSIAAKISVALVCAVLVPMIFTAYYNLQQSLGSVEAGEYRKLELLASSSASRFDQLIIDHHRVVAQVSSDPHVIDFLAADTSEKRESYHPNLQLTLQKIFRSHPDIDSVLLMDRKGQCVAATDSKLIGQNYSAIQKDFYGFSVLVDETTESPGMFFSQPVRSPDGEIVGTTLLNVRGENIWTTINANALDIGFQSNAFLIDQQGIVISHSDPSVSNHNLLPLSDKTLKPIVQNKRYGADRVQSLDIPDFKVMLKATQSGHATYQLPRSQSQIVGFAPLATQPWVLGVSQPKADFAAPLNRLVWLNGSSVLFVGVITAIIALLFGLSISRPIHALTTVAQALEDDNFDSHVLELHQNLAQFGHHQDDIGQLVRVFLKMAEEVRLRDHQLKIEVQELQIEIDEAKRVSQVMEITQNEHFEQLQKKIQTLRENEVTKAETEAEYYERLQTQVQSLKERPRNGEALSLLVNTDVTSEGEIITSNS
ncbi:HAMP domain-containing protein [Nostoc sp. FACHB-892]|uniref:cache domain-containing protein n=1 Tax=Nostoc sp. FACHB-892 TaxID=2692843 RepID=UPI0016840F2B|nr:cache domain-containing protein [Nostoc sp. FACHB-892]MBD2730565.1 HAMP domain-containing protein [Nostoc sp. FACHB-892]